MTDSTSPAKFTLPTIQLVYSALLIGAFTLGIIHTVMHLAIFQGKGILPDLPKIGGVSVLTLVGAVVVCVCTITAYLVPQSILRGVIAQRAAGSPEQPPGDDEALSQAWLSTSVIRGGLLEAPAILCLVLLLFSGDLLLLGVFGFLIAMLVVNFPRASLLESWMSEGRESLERARQNV